MKHKAIVKVLFCFAFLIVFLCGMDSISVAGAETSVYGVSGYYCDKTDTNSGMAIIGDSRCCQLWKYYKSAYGTDGANFGSSWGGHYGYGESAGAQIDTTIHKAKMKSYIQETIRKTGFCNVFVFPTVNDMEDCSWYNKERPYQYNVQFIMEYVKEITAWSGVYGGRIVYPTVYVANLVGEQPEPFSKEVDGINEEIQTMTAEINSSLARPIRLLDISDCIHGFIDRWHYDNETLAAIWQRMASCSQAGTSPASVRLQTPVLAGIKNSYSSVILAWKAVEGAPKYRIFRKTEGGTWARIADVSGDVIAYKDAGVKSGTSYTYTVRCLSSDGKSYISGYDANGLSIKYLVCPSLPVLTNTAKGINITWNKVPGAERYRVFRKTGTGGWSRVKDTASNVIVDTNVQSGTTYIYTVRCINSTATAYASAYNPYGKSIGYLQIPAAVVRKSGTQAEISWNRVPGAAKYRIYRKTAGGGWTRVADTISLKYTDTKPLKGVTSYYTVRAINGTNISSFVYSNAVWF